MTGKCLFECVPCAGGAHLKPDKMYSAIVAENRVLAERHVELGRRIVERQEKLVATKKGAHLDTSSAEQLLTVFLATQKIFEDDLARLLKTESR